MTTIYLIFGAIWTISEKIIKGIFLILILKTENLHDNTSLTD